jgi:predicted nucleic acid-binding protein
MADPIILDTNVLKDISRGNTAVADALTRYIKSGTPVYISRAANGELVTRAETPQLGGHYREMLHDLKIQIAPSGGMTDRLNVIADNIQHNAAPNRPGPMKEYDRTNDPTKPGDAFVAAQAKAINARLWTRDRDMIKRAPQIGVKLAPECSIRGISGPENPVGGRQLLGLPPKSIGPNGQVLPSNSAGGGGGGTYSIVGVADNTLPETVGPSPKGTATIAGIQLAFEGVNFVLNVINDHVQKNKVNEALDKIRKMVAKDRADNPRMGVLLMFYYSQVEAPQESIMKPGAAFEYVIWGKGVTIDEARQDALRAPTMSRGTGRYERSFSQEVWLPPLQRSAITAAKCPFPPIAIGRFFVGSAREAKFQLVEFTVFGGFDDIMEKTVELPDNGNADFAILKAPPEVSWYNMNGRQTVSVPLKEAKTANGNTINVVDLDPYSPFHAKAVMVFPIDDWSEKVFGQVRPTDNYQLLATYVNFRMIRWIRPDNIHLLRFL